MELLLPEDTAPLVSLNQGSTSARTLCVRLVSSISLMSARGTVEQATCVPNVNRAHLRPVKIELAGVTDMDMNMEGPYQRQNFSISRR